MANIKQIEVDNVIYDIEDSVARDEISNKAELDSPAFTGIPTAPTAAKGNNTTQLATTAFVQETMADAGKVKSVNGETGDVQLTAEDVGALPSTTVIPSKTSELTNDSGFITASGIPVQSVNGKTGVVNLVAGDVGALPSSTKIPSVTSDLTNDSGYITSADVPVKSVNGKTGAVILTATDVDALPSSTKIPTKTSDITNDSGYITETDVPTKTSELTNDSGFITDTALEPYAKSADIPTKVSELDNDSGFVNATQAKDAAPVQSVDGATGAVVTNAIKTTSQMLTEDQKAQARTNIGAGTSSFDGNYNSLNNQPTIPTKVSQLENDSNYVTGPLSAKVEQKTDGAVITIIDNTGTTTATVADGTQWFTGNDYPSGANEGDLWLYTDRTTHPDDWKTGDVMELTGTGWELTGNIRGAQGTAGANGKDGAAGTPGTQWFAQATEPEDGVRKNDLWLDANGAVCYAATAEGMSVVNWKTTGITLKGTTGEKGTDGTNLYVGTDPLDIADTVKNGDSFILTAAKSPWSAYDLLLRVDGAWTVMGNIKGEKGDKGDAGAAGHTPEKGVDYWTSADQASMVQQVVAALPKYAGGVS